MANPLGGAPNNFPARFGLRRGGSDGASDVDMGGNNNAGGVRGRGVVGARSDARAGCAGRAPQI